MKWLIEDLKVELERLLHSAGFPDEHYIIKLNRDYICVMFDAREAVEYFRGDFENHPMADDCVFEYKQDGKRHCAMIHPC